jgi:hypothetical protein
MLPGKFSIDKLTSQDFFSILMPVSSWMQIFIYFQRLILPRLAGKKANKEGI